MHWQKARIHIQLEIRSVDLHFVQAQKHKFCVLKDYTSVGATGCQVTRWKQVSTVLLFSFRAAVLKTGGCSTFLGRRDHSQADCQARPYRARRDSAEPGETMLRLEDRVQAGKTVCRQARACWGLRDLVKACVNVWTQVTGRHLQC